MKINKYSILLGVVGIIILILAIVLGFVVFPKTVQEKIKQELKLVRGTPVWNKWVDIESPIYISFHIFHVTNPDEVENLGDAPNLQEVGPYVYRQRRQKIDPHSESCKETIKYEQKITYWFDETRSGGRTEDDLVNVVNVPFVSVITGAAKLVDPITLGYLSGVLSADKLIRRNVKVGELLFKGFDVSNYDISALRPMLPPEFSGFRFGLYKGRNGSTDGEYEIYTGAKTGDDIRFGQIKAWKNSTSLNYWGDSDCDTLSGTDGSIFRPFLEEDDSITIFNTDLCRLLQLTFKEKVTVKELKGYRFTPPKEVLEGAANNPNNKCYCKKADISECQDGVIDLGVCRNGAPIVLSTPYFLNGYSGYAEAVGLGGMANPDKHETRIDIEPRTGLLLEAHKKIQMNMQVTKIEGVSQLANVKNQYLFPAIWLDEEASICEVDVEDMKSRIEQPIKAVNIARWVGIGVGAALLIVAVVILFACQKRKRSESANITLKAAEENSNN